jgi:PmbA protein
MQYEELTQELVDLCLTKGAESAEVYVQEGRQLSLEVRNGEMETIQESSSHGAGFRVFKEGKMGFAHSNDLSDASLDQAIQSAIDFAGHMTADEHNVLPSDPGVTPVEGLFDPELGSVSMEGKIALITRLEELAMADRRITVSNGAGYGEGEGAVYLANSNGLAKSYRSSGCNYGVSVVAEKGEQRSSGGEYCSRRFF